MNRWNRSKHNRVNKAFLLNMFLSSYKYQSQPSIPTHHFPISSASYLLSLLLPPLTQSMAAQTIDSYREGAEIYKGDELCKKKSIELLEELCLPKGLFPLEDIEEFGYNREAGFIWLIQKKKKDHVFKKIKRAVSYAAEVTAFVEKYKLKKMTGVKTKELLLWLSVVEVYFEKPTSEKLTFKTGTGLSDSFEASAFEL